MRDRYEARLKALVARRRRLDRDIAWAVAEMYQREYPWPQIADALGMTLEDTHRKYGA
jgi:hypothetical protein